MGVVSIKVMHYVGDNQSPSLCDSFFLSIDQYELLPLTYDGLIQRHFVGKVSTSIYDFIPPVAGRYLIGVVDEYNKRDVIEINYTGGYMVLTLIIP